MRIKSGLTLAEIVITMGVVGVLAAVLVPVLRDSRPNTEMLMLKKAYSILGRNVFEIVNDDDLYPDDGDGIHFGLSNTAKGYFKGEEFSGSTKFCQAFAAKMNLKTDVNCDSSETFSNGSEPTGNFTSIDGIVWIVPKTNFSSDATIWVDVNGDKKPNCSEPDETSSASCAEPDRFSFTITKWGKISVDGDVASAYLDTQKITKKAGEL